MTKNIFTGFALILTFSMIVPQGIIFADESLATDTVEIKVEEKAEIPPVILEIPTDGKKEEKPQGPVISIPGPVPQEPTPSVNTFTGILFEDANEDGKYKNKEEKGIPNRNVKLYDRDWVFLDRDTTSMSGRYTFTSEDDGRFFVCPVVNNRTQLVPARDEDGERPTRDEATTIVNNQSGETNEGDFCFMINTDESTDKDKLFNGMHFATIKEGFRGFVYLDENRDGKFEKSEEQLANKTIRLYRGNWTFLEEVETRDNGYYFIPVQNRVNYNICVVPGEGFEQTKPSKTGRAHAVVANESGSTDEGDYCLQIKEDTDGTFGNFNFGIAKEEVIEEPTPTPGPTNNPRSGGGSPLSPRSRTLNTSDDGEVLGASTSEESVNACLAEPYLTSFIKAGELNSKMDVMKLQAYLNVFEDTTLSLSGIYDATTQEAVMDYQVKYGDEILTPWVDAGFHESSEEATGYVYLTTRKHINESVCGMYTEEIEALIPDSK